MHEFSVISSIIELVKAEMAKAKASEVMEVHLQVGELTFLSHEALQFGFGVLAGEDGRIRPDALRIETVPAEVKCEKCGYKGPMKAEDDEAYHVGVPIFQCPRCSGPVEVLRGRECTVRNLRMEVP
jgi:hydrogenase nickel insertion protein HypA